MTVTKEDGNRQNVFAIEPPVYIDPNYDYTMPHNEFAEKLNGRVAMISIILGMISYLTTGKLFFGVW